MHRVTKLTNRINVEIILPHAHSVGTNDLLRNFGLFVGVLSPNSKKDLISGPIILSFRGGVVISSPDPLHLPLAVVAFLVELTGGAGGIVDNGR